MRIIAGEYKGRRITAPKDKQLRPTTDKVKEAIFSMIAPYIEEAIIVDLFAGTGNLGLEALSRGAARVYFGDSAKTSLALIRENVKSCDAGEKSIILSGDYAQVIPAIREKADVIFLDPPYGKKYLEHCFDMIRKVELLKEEGIIVAEYDKDDALPDALAGFSMCKEKRYGRICVKIYAANN